MVNRGEVCIYGAGLMNNFSPTWTLVIPRATSLACDYTGLLAASGTNTGWPGSVR